MWRLPVRLVCIGLLVLAGGCSDASSRQGTRSPSVAPSGALVSGRADVGGYSLAYECMGSGSPTVILEAGYTASGIRTFGQVILPALARKTHVCTYDRAGDGTSDPRPSSIRPLTGATQAQELSALLEAIHITGSFVMVGHSYGGVISREFAATYAKQVVGMVLIDATSEPEIPVYDRLDAGPWIDGSVTPAPNQTIDIHATVRELEAASTLRAMPLVVITAGILQDQWLKTVPLLEAQAQTRLAALSSDSIHVVDKGVGHLIPSEDPAIVIAATQAVIDAARSDQGLHTCPSIFDHDPAARCIAPGGMAPQTT
jgi:pimeloyl-ACP methyl ester carboxylesterase